MSETEHPEAPSLRRGVDRKLARNGGLSYLQILALDPYQVDDQILHVIAFQAPQSLDDLEDEPNLA